jgi:imidazolonepropionase-like amidohydrolase
VVLVAGNVWDGLADAALGPMEILVQGGRIAGMGKTVERPAGALVVDLSQHTVTPGFIDCHVHVFLSEVYIRRLEDMPLTLMTAHSAGIMRGMLNRGFTTVRDTGGADWGIKIAVESGLIPGPRLFIAGRAIGPTGGHSDSRRRTDTGASCKCCNAMTYCMEIADGADAVRAALSAVRRALRATTTTDEAK